MSKIYGIARISTSKQNIERQIRNILAKYPEATIVKETYTGTKLEGRKEFENLLKILESGDKLIFDSVSRMSRNSTEGCKLYEDLFNKGITIEFLKEPYINTEIYHHALDNQIKLELDTGNKAINELMNSIIDSLNKYAIALAKEQIAIAFYQAQKEVEDLHQRTKEGILTAKLNGKQIGRTSGAKIETKKAKATKEIIIKHSKDFNGSLSDIECMKLAGVTKKTYYIYKKQLKGRE